MSPPGARISGLHAVRRATGAPVAGSSGACDAVCVIAASPVAPKQRVLAELGAGARESGAIKFRGRDFLRSITCAAIRGCPGRVQHAPRPGRSAQFGRRVYGRAPRPTRPKARWRRRGPGAIRTARTARRAVAHMPRQHEQRARPD